MLNTPCLFAFAEGESTSLKGPTMEVNGAAGISEAVAAATAVPAEVAAETAVAAADVRL
jgi:hypothetical protein